MAHRIESEYKVVMALNYWCNVDVDELTLGQVFAMSNLSRQTVLGVIQHLKKYSLLETAFIDGQHRLALTCGVGYDQFMEDWARLKAEYDLRGAHQRHRTSIQVGLDAEANIYYFRSWHVKYIVDVLAGKR